MEIPILQDIAIIFAVSIIVLFVCDKIKMPAIIGFLITGAFIGPNGFYLIKSHHEVEILAEIGVVLLMFTIGLELSIKELSHNKKVVLIGGSLQVGLSILIVFLIGNYYEIEAGKSIYFGFLVALSSTAIVIGILQEKRKSTTIYGKNIVAILIFQDIIMVVMMLLIPLLQPGGDVNIVNQLLLLLLKAIVIIGLVIVSAKFIIPKLMFQIAKNKSSDFFLLSVVTICLVIAWGSNQVGLSLGLGAFLAGLIISESEYSLRALGSILPFRGVFLSFFFISVGTLFNVVFLVENFLLVLVLTLGVIFGKALILFFIGGVLRLAFSTSIIVGLSLSQIGEFSFMLSKLGLDSGLLDSRTYQVFLSVAILSMILTPMLIFIAPKVSDLLLRLLIKVKIVDKSSLSADITDSSTEKMEYHLIIIGFGFHGRLLAKVAKEVAIPYLILEMDAEVAKEQKELGEPILYGDATHESLLEHASVQNAYMVIIALKDIKAACQVTALVRKMNPRVHIVAKTDFILEVGHLTELGADKVVPVEFEAALEIERQMMTHFMIPQNEIDLFMNRVRDDGYFKYLEGVAEEVFDQTSIDDMFTK